MKNYYKVSLCILVLILTSCNHQSQKREDLIINKENNSQSVNQDNGIPYTLTYIVNRKEINEEPYVEYRLTLTRHAPYAKVHYTNLTNQPAKIYLSGASKQTMTAPAQSNKSYTWKKSGIGNKEYIVGVQSNGVVNLTGILTIAYSDQPFN